MIDGRNINGHYMHGSGIAHFPILVQVLATFTYVLLNTKTVNFMKYK